MIDLDLLDAAVRIEIMHLQKAGGVTDWHIEEAQQRLRSIRDENVSESMLFRMPETKKTFSMFAECLAVLACVPGGVTFAGRHFNANEKEDNKERECEAPRRGGQ